MSIPDSLTILSFEINNLYIPFLPKCLLFWMVNSKRYSLNEWSKVPGEPRQAHTLLSFYYCPQIPFKQKPASEWSDLTPSVMRNKILTVSQLGPCSNGVPSEILCDVWSHLQTSLWQLPLLPLPQEEERTRGSGPRASPSWRLSAVTSLLHLHQAPKPHSSAGDPLAYQTGTLDLFFHLENDIWPGRHCIKIGHVNLTTTCNSFETNADNVEFTVI